MEKNRDNTHTFKNDEREVEKIVGIEVFSTSGLDGIRGTIKNGHILEINEDYAPTSYSVESKDNYTTFNLVKINKDTFEAVRLISNALGIAPKAIEYSGLKDKRAISVQQASIKGNHIEKLKKLKINDIFIRNINPSKYPVKLGSNWG
ncbi:MAG: tRNA pseudouridine(13) synthase TruD, partial [Promethearchaeota archaeon]